MGERKGGRGRRGAGRRRRGGWALGGERETAAQVTAHMHIIDTHGNAKI